MQPFIEEKILDAIKKQDLVGMSISIVSGNKLEYSRNFGLRSIEDKIELTPETLFPIGSISKIFCALVILRLVDQKILSLNKPIIEYLQKFEFSNKYYGSKITLRHLLSHTS